jgi:hypothetical protein
MYSNRDRERRQAGAASAHGTRSGTRGDGGRHPLHLRRARPPDRPCPSRSATIHHPFGVLGAVGIAGTVDKHGGTVDFLGALNREVTASSAR